MDCEGIDEAGPDGDNPETMDELCDWALGVPFDPCSHDCSDGEIAYLVGLFGAWCGDGDVTEIASPPANCHCPNIDDRDNPDTGDVDDDNDGTIDINDDDDDNDGELDVDDDDDDNDGVCDGGTDGTNCVANTVDGEDNDEINNNFVCGDSDDDGCEDCVTGTFDPANDGWDYDGDGLCDVGINGDGSYNLDGGNDWYCTQDFSTDLGTHTDHFHHQDYNCHHH
jgi:hypothetical protein